ncbi:MAG TPA: MurT ligase domain-containing protein [Acidimicrobiales bacterium]|nr:MurT ligase domain-containing protein [Acidimicrobiales bacterium]
MSGLRTRLASRAGAGVAALSRSVGAGDGSVIGGRVSLALDPGALASLGRGHPAGLVSGTNGKTTTTRLLAAALETAGPVVTNLGGANLPPGLVTALARAGPGAMAALEVDEAYVPRVAQALSPRALCLLNLSRDQLDRINEVRMLAGRWRSAVAAMASTTVVANADDPMVAWAAGTAPQVVWVAGGLAWHLDATGCPACEGVIAFAGAGAGAGSAGGEWSCTAGCGLRRPRPEVLLDGADLVRRSEDGEERFALSVCLPGAHNRANAMMAAVTAAQMGVSLAEAARAVGAVGEVAGRYGVVRVEGAAARLILAKNPAGWMTVFDLLAPGPLAVAINARVADGRDPSWLWDVPFERLAGRTVVATGERCRDLAVRLRYAGVDHVTEADLGRAVTLAHRLRLSQDGAGGPTAAELPDRPVDVVANYTSFQALRRLGRRGGGERG